MPDSLRNKLAALFALATICGAVLGYALNPVFDVPVYDLEFQRLRDIPQPHLDANASSVSCDVKENYEIHD